jgi:hypothetical protein
MKNLFDDDEDYIKTYIEKYALYYVNGILYVLDRKSEYFNMIEEINNQIQELEKQVSYWRSREFDINPKDWDMLKTTITSLEYVIYNLQKMKVHYEQDTQGH